MFAWLRFASLLLAVVNPSENWNLGGCWGSTSASTSKSLYDGNLLILIYFSEVFPHFISSKFTLGLWNMLIGYRKQQSNCPKGMSGDPGHKTLRRKNSDTLGQSCYWSNSPSFKCLKPKKFPENMFFMLKSIVKWSSHLTFNFFHKKNSVVRRIKKICFQSTKNGNYKGILDASGEIFASLLCWRDL